MPVHAAPGGFRFGRSGHVFRSKAKAEAQARAIYATGWREDRSRRAAHKVLSASRKAELAYVSALQRILGAVHRGVLHVVEREHLGQPAESSGRHDADQPRIGLGDEFLRRMLRFVRPQAQMAFDFMANEADKRSAESTHLIGIRPRDVHGLAKVIDTARRANVELITNATTDFLDQVRDTLADLEGAHPKAIAKALQERAGVSKSRAILIARTETNKLSSQLNAHRQQAAGVERFVWSSVGDERTRESHRALNGRTFSWAEGIPGDVAAEVDEEEGALPGQLPNCRCVGLPVISELEEEPATEEEFEPEDEPMAAE